MAVTQHLRREGTVISGVSIWRTSCAGPGARPTRRHPACAPSRRPRDLCPQLAAGELPISFFLTRDDTVTVKVIDAEGNAVRTLAQDVALVGHRRHCFPWDGRTDGGHRVRKRRFRLLVTLRNAGRQAVAGEPIVLPPPGAGAL
jgi:hypothetical protein